MTASNIFGAVEWQWRRSPTGGYAKGPTTRLDHEWLQQTILESLESVIAEVARDNGAVNSARNLRDSMGTLPDYDPETFVGRYITTFGDDVDRTPYHLIDTDFVGSLGASNEPFLRDEAERLGV